MFLWPIEYSEESLWELFNGGDFQRVSDQLSIGREFLKLPSGRLPNVYQSTNPHPPVHKYRNTNTQIQQYKNPLIQPLDTLTKTAAHLPPMAFNCVCNCINIHKYRYTQVYTSIDIQLYVRGLSFLIQLRSQSEKLKTAVLIVSLSWQEAGDGWVSGDSGTANWGSQRGSLGADNGSLGLFRSRYWNPIVGPENGSIAPRMAYLGPSYWQQMRFSVTTPGCDVMNTRFELIKL